VVGEAGSACTVSGASGDAGPACVCAVSAGGDVGCTCPCAAFDCAVFGAADVGSACGAAAARSRKGWQPKSCFFNICIAPTLRPSAPRPKAQNVNARCKPNKRRPEMPVTPPANRDRNAAKFAVRRRRRRAREVALADLDAVRRQIETGGRLPHVQKVSLVDLARGGPMRGRR
jgi:hypothetical protein